MSKSAEINAYNIITPSLDELSEEHRQAYAAIKKQRQEQRMEAYEVLMKQREEEDLQFFLGNIDKTRQGNITPVGEIKLPPLDGNIDEITVSKVFSKDQLAMIESLVSKGNDMMYNAFLANSSAQTNMPPSSSGTFVSLEKINPTLPISSAPPMQQYYNLPMYSYPSQTNQLVTASTYPNPIMSATNSVPMPNYFATSPVGAGVFCLPPNYGSAPIAQVAPIARAQVSPISQASTPTTDPILAKLREDLHKMFQDTFGSEPKVKSSVYQKPYPAHFDAVLYPQGYKVPDFVKFSGEGTKTTREHVSQYLAQLGEAGSIEELKVRLFSLSLTGTAFSWFATLPHASILLWSQLEHKFHDHFYSGDNELKFSHRTSVR